MLIIAQVGCGELKKLMVVVYFTTNNSHYA